MAFGRNTKTDDARAASQPKRRRRGAVRRANGLSADDTPYFHLRLARHRASPASFRPSGRPRVVGHETLRVTKGHESTHPSVVRDTRQSQSAQASSGKTNSSWTKPFAGGLRPINLRVSPLLLWEQLSRASRVRFCPSAFRVAVPLQLIDAFLPMTFRLKQASCVSLLSAIRSLRRACTV